MDYKLYDEFITLQSLLKTTGILPSGGAIKAFLAENKVLFNGEPENRRGKKIRIGDILELPDQNLTITILAPNQEEIIQHQEDLAEKERVARLVKKMNQTNKSKNKQKDKAANRGPVRFPGT